MPNSSFAKPALVALMMAACTIYFLHDRSSQRIAATRGPVAEAPSQTSTAAASFRVGAYEVEPVAAYAIRARVLSTERYRLGREADLSPLDLAVGWGPMSDAAIINRLQISQANRWYMYRWQNAPPAEPSVIAATSANMHVVPATAAVRERLLGIERGAVVRLSGYLINVRHADGWQWRTSLTRSDTGGGSCELMWVEEVEIET